LNQARAKRPQLIRILHEAPGNPFVDRVEPQSEVVVSIDGAMTALTGLRIRARYRRLCHPSASIGAQRPALGAVPIRSRTDSAGSRCSPDRRRVQMTSRPLGDCVAAFARAKAALPANPCSSIPAASGSGPTCFASPLRGPFSERVSARDEGTVSSSFIACERRPRGYPAPQLPGRGLPSAFGVDVYQAHLDSSERFSSSRLPE